MTGGHTQASRAMASFPGVKASSAAPVVPMAAAGTKAQRWGLFV